jgi:outer membrane PBP1 activator LpoA protein
MRYRLAKVLLCAAFGGLCIAAQANTTELPLTAQTDLSIPPPEFAAAPLAATPAALAPRIALLLPLHSASLLQAANAVRAGFMAAHDHEQDEAEVDVIDTGDTPAEIVDSYTQAVAHHDIIVGPLSRSGVSALIQGNVVNRPTIALTQPEGESALPPQLLAIGLSIEDEARQAAIWMAAERKINKVFVVSTSAAWQRRAANAFAAQWQQKGKDAQLLELPAGGGFLEAKGLAELKNRLQAEGPAMIFAALDARQAKQLRAIVGSDAPLYGTSQLNPLALPDWDTAERTNDLDGARFLDLPWQLQSDDAAVMSYPRMEVTSNEGRSADLERLYALGIDAYRIAHEIGANQNSFTLDGVTGKLSVRFWPGSSTFSRIEDRAVYQHGVPVVIDAH